MTGEPFDLEFESPKLTRNAVRCEGCDAVIESHHQHDFVTCECGDVSIDGGLDYARVVAHPLARFERLT